MLYIRLRAAGRKQREAADEGVSVDYDADGHVIGFEVADARKRLGVEELTNVTYENTSAGKRSRLTLP